MPMGARFAAAHAPGETWTAACEAVLRRLGPDSGDGTLGFVYVSDAFASHMAEIATVLRRETGIVDWTGTVGVGVLGPEAVTFGRPGIAVLTAPLPPHAFRILPPLTHSARGFLDDNIGWVELSGPLFGIVHADPRNPATPSVIQSLAQAGSSFLVGGLTSSRTVFAQLAGGVTEGGVSGVLLSAEVPVATGLTQGCSPLGRPHRITASEKNVLITLDGRPALEVLKADIGELLARDLRRALGYVHAAIPVQGSDTGDYMVRNIMAIDVQREWVAIGEQVETGGTVMFCRRDPASAQEDLRRMLRGVRARLDGQPRGGLYFSCVGRGPYMFGDENRELAIIKEELGSFPLAGFYANGEISRDRLYGYTGVLALFAA